MWVRALKGNSGHTSPLSFLIGVKDLDYGRQIQQAFHTASSSDHAASPHMILLVPEGGA